MHQAFAQSYRACNQRLYFEYDALDRLVKKRQDSANGPLLAEYQFDATGQKGLLSRSKAYTAEGVVEISNVTYDVRGRLTQQNWIVPGTGGGAFRLDHTYNAADQPATLRYPGGTAGQQGELVTYGYNGLGQLNSVSGSGVSYVSSTTYNARGQVTEQRLDTGSNGLTRQYVYDANTMRLTTLRAGVANPYTNLQNLSYTYDAVGNVTSIVDGVNSSQRQCFGYDALDRLTSAFTGNAGCTVYAAGGTGPYNHTYVYDAVGNITSYAGASYTYGDAAHKHAVTGAYGNTYGYDANGNQTTRTIAGTTYTFTFDYENRLTEVKQGSTSLATFLYDADGNRVKGTVSGVTTVYIAGIYEYQGGATTKYYEGGGLRRTGYSTNNGVFYMLSDHLKSTSALVARNGVLNVKYFYYPYGARRGVPFNTITSKHFTGQYHETSLPGGEGLSFYNARWYDPKLGRFLSADTIVPNPSNPQDLNRFTYVRNNPLRFVDPSGHILCDGATSCAQGGSAQPGSGAAKKPPAPPRPKPAPNPNKYGNNVKLQGKVQDTRNLDQWLVGEANHLARLPEGQTIRALMNSSSLGFNAIGLYIFYQLVRDGAPLDYKDQTRRLLGDGIQLNGKWYEWSTAGNILYGFYGAAWGISEQLLYAGAGYAQWSDYRSPDPGETTELGPWYPPFYDDTTDDHFAIVFGIRLFSSAYVPDHQVTVNEFQALLTDYQHADDMALWTGTIGLAPQNVNWPYYPGYFNNSQNPPTPGWMFPSFN